MSGIMSVLQELYIRFMVWLGAEPPSGYEHLLKKKPSAKKPAPPAPPKAKPPVEVKPPLTAEPPVQVKPPPVAEPPVQVKPPPIAEPPVEVKPPLEVVKPAPPPEVKPEPPAPVTEKPDEKWLEAAKPVVAEQPPLIVTPEPPVPSAEAPVITTEELVFKYEVQRGDTLNAVARKYGLTVKDLLAANNINDATGIYPGEKLVIPGYMLPSPELETELVSVARPAPPVGDQFIYTVTGGDTLNSIAKRYGITVLELIEANTLEDPQRIRIGQKLVIPGMLTAPRTGADSDFVPVGMPGTVRAVYASYFATGHNAARQQLLDLLSTTELNAIVIDAKSNDGLITYPTQDSLAREIGADQPAAQDFSEFMARLKQEKIYTIARIVTFKDSPLALNKPELAVKNSAGGVWQDNEKTSWCDPFLQPVWAYNIQLAKEAASLGFNEIQFDFARFPTKSQAGEPKFSQPNSRENRVAAITGFLSAARGQLAPFKVRVSARVSGYTCWRKDDSLIGQDIERMSEYLDVLCPILAPSTFHAGIPGHKNPIDHPYEVVFETAKRATERLSRLDCNVRPWLQDFRDYRFDKRPFGKAEIQAQISASFDAGCSGFITWNPGGQYTANAYAPVTAQS